ncbi:LLM class flavin-dependent oxidoreductase [Corynebacterium nuruki]|uniref:LLM class flavin-dependent oxidoreductase n=1 Tax=Corynebacterium nuruki TaxID=1032851 RepID=UPI0039BF8069
MSTLIPDAGIITAANFPGDSPGDRSHGLEATLKLISAAEDLGFDTAGIRQRQLEHGSSSALTILAAAGQRTSRIRLETSVIPLGFEVPFRLAEDVATVDALSGGRLTVGVSTSSPHSDLLGDLNRPDFDPRTDPYELLDRFLTALRSENLAEDPLPTPYGATHEPAVHPRIADAVSRVWLGAGSERSVDRAAARGLGIFLGNIIPVPLPADGAGDGADAPTDATFTAAQRATVDRYRAAFTPASPDSPDSPGPRVAVERVIVPLDSATPQQRERHLRFAASREDRTRSVQRRPGQDSGVLFQRDLVGDASEIIERLRADPVFDGSTGLRIALPYALDIDDYLRIITDIRTLVLPELSWSPAPEQRQNVPA